MKTVCDKDNCAGCMLCTEICPKGAIHIEDRLSAYNAVIDENKCVNCNICHNKCPQNNIPQKTKPIQWYQGWNNDENARMRAPSGGIGMALMTNFIKDGGYVASCAFDKGEFVFFITNRTSDITAFMGSKYVKSNPIGIFKKIDEIIRNGSKVLFVGLPCQCAAIKRYINEIHHNQLFLVDLICHGTPSPKLLEMFLSQYSIDLYQISSIKFRSGTKYQLVIDDKSLICDGVSDKYSIVFGSGIINTANCYECRYASEERVSDVTIGDSWGTTLGKDEIKKGISLILVQTGKGLDLLKMADVKLLSVDSEIAKKYNGRLNTPLTIPVGRESFFNKIFQNSFNSLVLKKCLLRCLKQDAKYILIKFGLIKGRY